MSAVRKGIRRPLSAARKVAIELLHHADRVPSLPLAYTFNVAALAAARQQLGRAPSWMAIFMRAYGLVASAHPELRRALIPWPWPHFYEHPHSEAAVLVEREWEGEAVVLGAKVRAPETLALGEIDERLRRFRTAPVWEVPSFRQILRIGRLPHLLRRFTFWQTLYLSGSKRGKRLGTFMISSLGTLGVEQMHPLTPLTTYVTFGPIDPSGQVTAKIICDPRVLDGRAAARCLRSLENELHSTLLEELHQAGRTAA